MRNWFDARAATEFGASLAVCFSERVPRAGGTCSRSVSKKKRDEAFPKLFGQIDRFKAEHKLNFYKKAKMGNAFRWKLVDLGYDATLVDEVTKEVLLRL